ncbi:hypothetical protein M5K25_009067 [Dendrobium thyrsiflorum]|uniref:Uncharacterized protein n=1 Tax=Dendrobium thyrsiflorum TaxID=117978 RepID=A0ABD0V5U0_DENTH
MTKIHQGKKNRRIVEVEWVCLGEVSEGRALEKLVPLLDSISASPVVSRRSLHTGARL